MSKQILFNAEARKALLSGINQVAKATISTFGYGGKNVLISQNMLQTPITSRDGVTVAKSIFFKDPIENAAALLTKSVAEKTVEQSGDGTTASILLFQNIVNKAFEYIEQGANSVELKKGIEKATALVVEELKNQSIPIGESNEMIKQIATVSANNDEVIGELIADAFKEIGNNGIILIEESKSIETSIRVDDGYQIDRGYTSGFWITNKEKMICELVSPFILFVDGKVDKFKELMPVLNSMLKSKRNDILIIADSVEGEAMDTLIYNKLQGGMNVVVINAPSYGERRKQMMEDMAIITGGKYISQDYALILEETDITGCGTCEKVVVTKDTTTIVNGDGQKSHIASRSLQIKSLIEQSESEIEIEILKQRLAKLNGGIAVFSVGGVTETEMREKKDRVDDAIRATKCAIEEGIVAGGGMALLRCIDSIQKVKTENKYQKLGVAIIEKVLKAPVRQILINAGIPDNNSWSLFKNKETTCNDIINELIRYNNLFGYNVKSEKIENLMESGIIDPTKVIRTALENAVSMACMVIISECLVVEIG